MAAQPSRTEERPLLRWLLEGQPEEADGPFQQEGRHRQHSWWQVMCLTGVDYFSTLGYQPGIAALAAGALAPVATLLLVLLTLFGALPIYRRVAAESPHGEGSIAILERMLSWWQSKLFVLVLLGFVATDFIITITLSAADAAAHIIENPFVPAALSGQAVAITLALVLLLGAVFLRGFTEAIGIAVVLVLAYLTLNAVVLGYCLWQVALHPRAVGDWLAALSSSHGSPLGMLGVALLVFPRLALGLSGFETGVAVMPQVRGAPGDTERWPEGRIRNTRALLFAAAVTMSVFLISSSVVTTLLIPPEAFQPGGEANGRALAYLAHAQLGNVFGTVYDISTILILWFAGASAMAGLLNIVPRYLPRYGMAPAWTRAARPLVLVYIAVAVAITLIFRADVNAQGGAYATGVLVLMTSAAVAVTISAWHRAGLAPAPPEPGRPTPTLRRGPPRPIWQRRLIAALFGLITLVFAYTTVANVIERPDGVRIASVFIVAILALSLVSRAARSTELRTDRIELDEVARRLVEGARGRGVRVIANELDTGDAGEYAEKEREAREDLALRGGELVFFLEVTVVDASEFTDVIELQGVEVGPYCVLRARGASIANTIAAVLLFLRDETGAVPHVYFTWVEGRPLRQIFRFLVLGSGDIAPLTHEVLRRSEPARARRPVVHIVG